jgi:shikimate kinase
MPLLVLVGPPGAGKTTVGRLVADRLGVAFADTDADIEAETGMTVADIFVEHGEPAFRRMEHAAVLAALSDPARDGAVVSLGGGAVLDSDLRAALRDQPVVFLSVGLPDAAQRVGFNRDRPLLLGNPRGQWLALSQERLPLYREVARHEVVTDGRTADQVADDVIATIGVDR